MVAGVSSQVAAWLHVVAVVLLVLRAAVGGCGGVGSRGPVGLLGFPFSSARFPELAGHERVRGHMEAAARRTACDNGIHLEEACA